MHRVKMGLSAHRQQVSTGASVGHPVELRPSGIYGSFEEGAQGGCRIAPFGQPPRTSATC